MSTSSNKELVYGINAAFEAVLAGRRTIEKAILSKSSRKNPRLKKLTEVLERNKISYEWQEKGRLIDVCRSHDHQGVVLICTPFKYESHHAILETETRIILLNNIEDPHNVGAIMRSADLFGYHGVLMPDHGTPEIYASVVKVSAGASEYLRICRGRSANQYVKAAREAGFTIVALDGKGKVALDTLKTEDYEKVLLVIGGEDKGVGQFILNEADMVSSIPQCGRINSLNASVAAGVAMYTLRKK